MNQAIKDQRKKLKEAIAILDMIESIEEIFGSIDSEYVKQVVADLQNEYASKMAEITNEILISGNLKLTQAA